MSNNVQDKVIVITGASSGMGEAAARHLAQQGAKVVLGARRIERLDALVKTQASGQFITTSSVAGHLVFPASAVYSGTKHAVRAICEGLRQEVKPYNIRSTILCPGAVRTELLEQISDPAVKAANSDYVGQVGIPSDSFARMAAFAISQPEDVDVNEIIFRPTAQQL